MSNDHPTTPGVFDTTTQRFMTDVVERSLQVTVAVDFWAPWCGPCRQLAPMLEELVRQYGGRLMVARVNTDAEPALAAQFGIRSIPDVRVFRDGNMVDGFVGVQPMARLRALFDRHVARPSEGLREQARASIERGDFPQATELLRRLLADEADNVAARIDLADALARNAEFDAAEAELERLPPNAAAGSEVATVRARIQLGRAAAAAPDVGALRDQAARGEATLEDLHRLGAYELVQGHVERGLEDLLAIVRRDRRFQDGLGQRSLVLAFQLLGEKDERVAQYRRKLTQLLY